MDNNLTDRFFTSIGLDPNASPAITFSLFEKQRHTNQIYKYEKGTLQRLKSRGSIQSMLELHTLMNKSLQIISPHLILTPDFPDYLLSIDNPNYDDHIPAITATENMEMPHHRNDLYVRSYDKYPSLTDVPIPAVTWGVVRTEPGALGGPMFSGVQEIVPRDREFIAIFDPNIVDFVGTDIINNQFIEYNGKLVKFIRIKGQYFDNLVQYNMWARSSWEVEELTEWFHKEYLLKYTGMFREAGIVNMIFNRRVRDDTLTQIKNKYHMRSILYYYRTENIDLNTIEPIKRIETNIHVGGLNNSGISFANNVAEEFDDNLLKRWHNNALAANK